VTPAWLLGAAEGAYPNAFEDTYRIEFAVAYREAYQSSEPSLSGALFPRATTNE
jgi:hypothetical protein